MDSLRQRLGFFWQTQRQVVIMMCIGIVLFICIISFAFLLETQPSKITTGSVTTNNPQSSLPNSLVMPTAHISGYKIAINLPTLPQIESIYSLKGNLSQTETAALAQKLGMNTLDKQSNNYTVISNTTDPAHIGYGYIDQKSGNFEVNYGAFIPSSYTQGQSPTQEATNYLSTIDLNNQTLVCTDTYQRQDAPGVTFVECHNSWQKLGLPLINPLGILSDSQTPLENVVLGQRSSQTPEDTNIINASDGSSGYARQNTFNTITVGITSNGAITSIDSTLRIINQSNVLTADNLISPQTALTQLNSPKTTTIILPTNTSDFANWNTTFPNNSATVKSSTITDAILTYIEKPEYNAQVQYQPMYIFRESGMLTNGVAVQVLQIVSAIKNSNGLLADSTQDVAGAQTQSNSSIQIQTFTPTSGTEIDETSPTLQPTPTTPVIQELVSCPNLQFLLRGNPKQTTLELPELGSINILYNGNGASNDQHTFYYLPPSTPGPSLSAVRQGFLAAVEQQYIKNTAYWFVQSGSPQLDTTDKVLSFFAAVDKSSSDVQYRVQYPVPLPPNLYNMYGKPFIPMFSNETQKIAERVIELYNQGTLTNYANAPDIFPQNTVKNAFQEVLVSAVYTDNDKDKFCYISGFSPSIFVYTPQPKQVRISLPQNTTYTSPIAANNVWKVTANSDGTIMQNNFSFNHLYYEYNGLTLTNPTTGFVISYDSWKEKIAEISDGLQLNRAEKDQLIQEVQNALAKRETAQYLQFSLANENELNTKIPLGISPKPNAVRRIHILISLLPEYKQISEPVVTPVHRVGFTFVELGARIEN